MFTKFVRISSPKCSSNLLPGVVKGVGALVFFHGFVVSTEHDSQEAGRRFCEHRIRANGNYTHTLQTPRAMEGSQFGRKHRVVKVDSHSALAHSVTKVYDVCRFYPTARLPDRRARRRHDKHRNEREIGGLFGLFCQFWAHIMRKSGAHSAPRRPTERFVPLSPLTRSSLQPTTHRQMNSHTDRRTNRLIQRQEGDQVGNF